MISDTPINRKPVASLPRRDLVALFQYLNRKELENKMGQSGFWDCAAPA